MEIFGIIIGEIFIGSYVFVCLNLYFTKKDLAKLQDQVDKMRDERREVDRKFSSQEWELKWMNQRIEGRLDRLEKK